MTTDDALRAKVKDAARATADIWKHIERLTAEAFAQQQETKADEQHKPESKPGRKLVRKHKATGGTRRPAAIIPGSPWSWRVVK
jgi:hypothetical protein